MRSVPTPHEKEERYEGAGRGNAGRGRERRPALKRHEDEKTSEPDTHVETEEEKKY